MTPHMTIILTLLTIGSIQGLILGFSMLRMKQGFIALWLGLFSVEIINKVLLIAGILPSITQWFGFWMTFDLLYGPLLYFWVITLVYQQPLKRHILLHFSPALLYFIVKIYSLMPISALERSLMIHNFPNDRWVIPDISLLHQIMHVASLFLPLLYAFLALFHLIKYRFKFNYQFSEGLEVRFDWLLNMVILHIIMWLVMLFILPLLNLSLTLSWIISYLPAVLWLNILAWLSLLYSQMILAKRHPIKLTQTKEKTASKDATQDHSVETTITKENKYATTRLEKNVADDISLRLTLIMSEGLFKQPRLALSELADLLELPSHWLSQVINDRFDCNFFDFVNDFRIQQIKLDLHDKHLENSNILDIAFNNGFNSKSTFNTVFKKSTGQTPSQFRKSAH
jgi:AraC-like DNA-binding protein